MIKSTISVSTIILFILSLSPYVFISYPTPAARADVPTTEDHAGAAEVYGQPEHDADEASGFHKKSSGLDGKQDPISQAPSGQHPNANKGISKHLIRYGLDTCRITQSEQSHHSQGGGSYGLDIACTRGVSYDVKAPNDKNEYQISYIGHDTYLGDYVVLKNGEERWVYGHTQTSKKMQDIVRPGDVIGQSNDSGKRSTGIHTHIEHWIGKYNVSHDDQKNKNTNSEILCKQREWKFCQTLITADPPQSKPQKFNLDKLAKAVSRAETGGCKRGAAISHNNCFGIMQWDDDGKRSFKKYATHKESFADFKRIWSSYYKEYPDIELAKKWTGDDKKEIWLGLVNKFYNE